MQFDENNLSTGAARLLRDLRTGWLLLCSKEELQNEFPCPLGRSFSVESLHSPLSENPVPAVFVEELLKVGLIVERGHNTGSFELKRQ